MQNEELKEQRSVTDNEPLPAILSFSAQKSHHVETDRTIRALTIRHTIKNVSKPIDLSSKRSDQRSATQKILLSEDSDQ